MQAVIMAGGKGKRLAPFTQVLPKPMLPLAGRPILEHSLNYLKEQGFNEIVITLGYLGSYIQNYFNDGRALGIPIRYVQEEEPLGTMGPLSLINNLKSPFLVLNGDIYARIDYAQMFKEHQNSNSVLTVAACNSEFNLSLGVIDEDGNKLMAYREKPTITCLTGMGIYLCNGEVLDKIPYNQAIDAPQVVNDLLQAGKDVGIFKSTARWLHINTPSQYEQACLDFSKGNY